MHSFNRGTSAIKIFCRRLGDIQPKSRGMVTSFERYWFLMNLLFMTFLILTRGNTVSCSFLKPNCWAGRNPLSSKKGVNFSLTTFSSTSLIDGSKLMGR